MDGEDDKHLKRVETLKGRFVWIPGGKEARELYEPTTLQLGIPQTCLLVEECATGADDEPSETDNQRGDGEGIYYVEHPRSNAPAFVRDNDLGIINEG